MPREKSLEWDSAVGAGECIIARGFTVIPHIGDVSYYKTAFTELAPGSLHSELVDNDRLLLTKQNSEYQSSIGEIVIGDYEYESEALFGSPSTSSGHWVYHPDTHLFGFAEEFGEFKLNSGPLQQLTEFCDVVGVEGVSAEETHELYNEYSTSVFDVRFTPGVAHRRS